MIGIMNLLCLTTFAQVKVVADSALETHTGNWGDAAAITGDAFVDIRSSRLFELDEGVIRALRFTLGAQIVVGANRALVAHAHQWTLAASIALDIRMNRFRTSIGSNRLFEFDEGVIRGMLILRFTLRTQVVVGANSALVSHAYQGELAATIASNIRMNLS
jgi:hypothetical protein